MPKRDQSDEGEAQGVASAPSVLSLARLGDDDLPLVPSCWLEARTSGERDVPESARLDGSLEAARKDSLDNIAGTEFFSKSDQVPAIGEGIGGIDLNLEGVQHEFGEKWEVEEVLKQRRKRRRERSRQ